MFTCVQQFSSSLTAIPFSCTVFVPQFIVVLSPFVIVLSLFIVLPSPLITHYSILVLIVFLYLFTEFILDHDDEEI